VIGEVSEERGYLRNKILVFHVSEKQSHFLIEALSKSGTEWTWTMCTWVKEAGSARFQGPGIRCDTEH